MTEAEQLRQYYLHTLGVTVWQENPTERIGKCSVTEESSEASGRLLSSMGGVKSQTADSENWQALQQQVATCMACALHKTRQNVVFGVGNPQAEIMFVGEAPGAQEDKKGEPFVGRAGQLLDKMLTSVNLHREQVFIANVLKCRPPGNRDPEPQEVAKCTAYLEQQIEFIKPRLLVALGRVAGHYLLDCTTPLYRMRNQIHHFGRAQTPLIVTYHPAYLLRNPKDKGKSYQDLLFILKQLNA